MPNAPIHYIVGIGFGTIISTIVYIIRKKSLRFLPLIITFLAVGSMLPDLPQFTNAKLDMDIGIERSHTHTPLANIFCLHPWIDATWGHEYDERLDYYAIIIIALAYAIICTIYAVAKDKKYKIEINKEKTKDVQDNN